jgi:hypothetical protein
MFVILIFIVNSTVCSNFLCVEVYFTLLRYSNFCDKVVWQWFVTDFLYVILSYIFLPLVSRFCFLLVKLIIDVDCCFVYTSRYHHTKWPQTFFKRFLFDSLMMVLYWTETCSCVPINVNRGVRWKVCVLTLPQNAALFTLLRTSHNLI